MAGFDTIKEKSGKLFKILFSDKKDVYAYNKRAGIRALFKKEFTDHFRSKRFLIVLLLIAITSIGSVVSSGSAIKESLSNNTNSVAYSFLSIYTTGGQSLPSLLSFLALLGPIVGLALGFDAVNGERSRRTLSRLVAQPIYRDTIINGKFIAGVAVISIMVLSLGIFVGGLGIIITGLPPTLDEFVRLLVFMIFTVVYMSFWLALSQTFSLLFRHAATSALLGIAIWLFLAFFLGMIAGLIANAVAPVDPNNGTVAEVMANFDWKINISRISPTTLFSESAGALLNPTQNAIGSMWTIIQYSGANNSMLPLGQSLLLVWPHLTALIALTIIVFAVSYICFMKQEIRA